MKTYLERAARAPHPLARRLLTLMEEKQSNLCVSVDLTNADDILALVDAVGQEACIIKTHIDIIDGVSDAWLTELQRLALHHNVLLFEDRKFADIGNTVQHQYAHGAFHIVDWADMVNAHIITGPGTIEGLRAIGQPHGRGLLLYVQMTPVGNLVTNAYTQQGIAWAEMYDDFVMGFISMEKLSDNPGLVHMTPGVHLHQQGDALGQQYNTPHAVIYDRGSDVIIVGRGIYAAPDPAAAAREYRAAGWQAYQARIA